MMQAAAAAKEPARSEKSKNRLPATPAGSPVVPSRLVRTTFRDDMDAYAQTDACAQQRMLRAQRLALADWKTTCATRESHRHMLLALLRESVLFRMRCGYPLPSTMVQQLSKEINDAMTHSDHDEYVPLLTKIARMNLFSSAVDYEDMPLVAA